MMPGTLAFMLFPPNNTFSMGNKHNAKRGRDHIKIGVFERQCFGIASASSRAVHPVCLAEHSSGILQTHSLMGPQPETAPYGLVNASVGGAHKMAGQLPMCFISLIDIERLVIEP
jgi:hypothetical protein